MPSETLGKTAPPAALATVLVVQCSVELLRRCAAASAKVAVSARGCDLVSMAEQAAQRRPVAIIVPSYLHEFDPTEFEALAQDVAAKLLVIDENIAQTDLDRLISDAGTGGAKEPRGTRGRYSVVGGFASEQPLPAQSDAITRVRLRVQEGQDEEVESSRSRVG
jgi:hypothetical protein